MLRLRPYKACDAEAIVSWIGNERAFRQWSADRFDHYPITAEDLNAHYAAMADSDRFFEMTACDNNGIFGHLIMRYTDENNTIVRFGFVIVDSARRGMGFGVSMLKMASDYAFEFLGARKITLGVFQNNLPAYRCYRAAGFREKAQNLAVVYRVLNENWNCIELELDRRVWVTARCLRSGPAPQTDNTESED